MMKDIIWRVSALIVGVCVSFVWAPDLVTRLSVPGWLAFVGILIDVYWLVTIPLNLPVYLATIDVSSRPSFAVFASYSASTARLLILLKVVIPIIGMLIGVGLGIR